MPLAQAAARGIDRFGGSVSRLRTGIIDGQVTSREFFDAILSQQDELAALFSQTVPTISQSLTILRNNLVAVVGEFNETTGVAVTLSTAIITLGNNLETIIRVGTILAVVIGTRMVAGMIAAEVAAIRVQAAAVHGAIGLNSMGAASRRAALGMVALGRAAGVLRGAVALLGGPIGIATLAAIAIFEFSRANRDARQSLEGLPEGIDEYRESIVALTEAQLANRNQNLTRSESQNVRVRTRIHQHANRPR